MAIVKAYTYTSDSGTNYNILLDVPRATSAGFSSGSATQPLWRYTGQDHCRGVHGVNPGGKRMFLPCKTQAQMMSLVASGSFVVVPYSAFTITGYRGERRTIHQIG